MAEDGEARSGDPVTSRRRFLGLGAAGLAAGAVGAGAIAVGTSLQQRDDPDATYGFTPLPARSEPGFDHLVVLMFENRSFDHLLGRLYDATTVPAGQTFEGVTGSNPAPDGSDVAAHVYSGPTDWIMSQPDPDPGEFFSHVNTQFFDTVDPASNARSAADDPVAPWNAPADPSSPTMSGFVRDYVTAFRHELGREPTADEYAVVMGGFSPDMLPVLSTLARSFAVFDHWFCAVPSQTFCNRSFFHASTSHGFVTNGLNGGQQKWLDADAVPTIFNRLEDAGLTWRVYYDAEQVVSLTGMLHAPSIEKYWLTNFRSMEQFHEDAANGTLPHYAFVEPRMIFDHNDMHPPVSRKATAGSGDDIQSHSAVSDMRAGEALLADVYSAIRSGGSATGSNAVNTALLVTFDEHGGIYDHVPPPAATPPDAATGAGEMGFGFDRLGGRVPAILVSAYTAAGTVINEEMHHGAVAKTLAEQHGLAPLTDRDASARSLHAAISLSTPRQPAVWPDVHAAYTPPNPEAGPTAVPDGDRAKHPLTAPAQSLIGLLLARYEPSATVPTTFADAYAKLHEHGEGLFGVRD